MPQRALDGIRVVELAESISGPFAARLLADLGADVLKVEPPLRGDPSRRHGPFPGDTPDAEKSGLYLALNTNKRGITLAVETPTGRELLLRLLRDADVLVTSLAPTRLEAQALSYESLKGHCPRLVYAAVTPLGLTGPYRTFKARDLNVQALGGTCAGIGRPDRAPLALPLAQSDYLAGLAAAGATLVALRARETTGQGQQVDVASVQVLSTLISFLYLLPNFIYRGVAGVRKGRRGAEAYFPNTIMATRDGYACLYPLQIEQYLRFVEVLGNPPWTQNPRYRNRRAMAEEYPDEAEALIAPWFSERSKDEIFQLCYQSRVPCVPVRTMDEVANDPHLGERGYYREVEHPGAGRLRHPAYPLRLSETPLAPPGPAPRLGEHNREVFCDVLGLSGEDLARLYMAKIV